jgi:hypothetical protein
MIEILLLLIFWVSCWVASTGITFAEFYQDKFYYKDRYLRMNQHAAFWLGIGGPGSLVASLIASGPGWHERKYKWLWPWGRKLKKIRMIEKLREKE